MLDVGLPDGNGLELLPLIQKTTNPPEVIIVTGYGQQDIVESAMEQGARDCLAKPTTLKNLKEKIERAITHHPTKTAFPPPLVDAIPVIG